MIEQEQINPQTLKDLLRAYWTHRLNQKGQYWSNSKDKEFDHWFKFAKVFVYIAETQIKGKFPNDKLTGTPTELFNAINTALNDNSELKEAFPKAPNAFSRRIGDISPILNVLGIRVTFSHSVTNRTITIDVKDLKSNEDANRLREKRYHLFS